MPAKYFGQQNLPCTKRSKRKKNNLNQYLRMALLYNFSLYYFQTVTCWILTDFLSYVVLICCMKRSTKIANIFSARQSWVKDLIKVFNKQALIPSFSKGVYVFIFI